MLPPDRALERWEGPICFVGALGRTLNVQGVRLACGPRAPPCSWTLLIALARGFPRQAPSLDRLDEILSVGDHAGTTPGFLAPPGTWRRRRRLVLLVFTATLTAAVSVAAFLPDVYRSTATLLVERLALAGSAPAEDLETPLRTLSQEILSRARLA